jgi:superfamily II DNA or RNA helicase
MTGMVDLFDVPARRKSLRPYQADAVTAVRDRLRRGSKRVVICLPTGGGKTLLASKIIEAALGKGGRAVFTVPAISLIDQTVDAFEAEGVDDVGVMQANHARTRPSAAVQVASVQTLDRRDLPHATVVLVDECHISARVIRRWMEQRPDLVFVGLSATPGRRGMADEWQDCVVATTTLDLIEAGYLSRFRVFAPSAPDMTGVKIGRDGDFETAGSARAMSEAALTADILQNWLANGEDRPTLGFAVDVAHAKRMAEDFDRAGVPSAYVEAATDRVERAHIARQFEAGRIRVIWSVRTMTTGVDLPVSGIIDAAPTRSAMLHQQKLGRGLRVNPGTEDLVIWDHAGNTERVGFLTDLDWGELLPAGKPREKERKKPLPRVCRACSAVMPPTTRLCASCGFELPLPSGYVETADGELIEVEQTKGKAEKRKATMEEKQVWYSALLALAIEKGRKAGSAYFRFKERFGVAPAGALPPVPGPVPPEVRSWAKSRDIAFAKSKRKDGACR